jgi:transposase
VDFRDAKAQELADRGRVVKDASGWSVFSLTSHERYRVTVEPPSCSCPAFETGGDCKHIRSVRITLAREDRGQHLTAIPDEPPIKWPRKSYGQRWGPYVASQVNERDEFLFLLHDLCGTIQEPPRKRGRPCLPLPSTVYSAILKIYSGLSVRRFVGHMREAQAHGYLSVVPHHNSVTRTLESPALGPILRDMIAQTSLSLKAVESEFALDSSGFSASKFDRWYDEKWGRMESEHAWVKAHAMVGTATGVVVAAEVLDKDSPDSPQLPGLVKAAAERFTVQAVAADKAYSGTANHEVIAQVGGTPYIMFKAGATGEAGGVFQQMYHLFALNREQFQARYHRRSRIESTFSAVKRKFGDSVRSRLPVAMKNEVLAKLVCFNLTRLIQAVYESGLEVRFGSERPADSEILRFPGI